MMSFKASFVLLLFALALVLSDAAELPAELYWKTKLGNIPMPKVLKDSLQQGSNDENAKINPQFEAPLDPEDSMTYFYQTPPAQGHETNNLIPILDDQECMHHYASESDKVQVPLDGRVIYFTHEKLFIAGTKMKLHFRKFDNGVKFLPLYAAKKITAASNQVQTILNILSVNPNSTATQYIEKTIEECQEKGVKDEVRFCTTSLEAMVDNVTLSLDSGKNKLMVVSTEEDKEILMEYTIQKAQKLGNDDNHTMVCHKLASPYAVFLCHNIRSTNVYSVSLVGANREHTKAIAVCHKDTSSWYPRHLAFRILKIKPGSKTICHFVSGDTVVWLRN